MTILLAGDIGGTKTILQLAKQRDNVTDIVAETRFESESFSDFDAILSRFLQDNAGGLHIDAACIGVAGPVSGARAQVTNLPWELDATALQSRHGIKRVELVNDFQTIGYAIDVLAPDDLYVVQDAPRHSHGVRAVIGAGTGLGEGWAVWRGDAYQVLPTEGGHVDFAPRDAEQDGLLRFLRGIYGPVSYEMVLSGPGLEHIYWYLQAREAGVQLAGDMPAASVKAPTITAAALQGTDALADQALTMFLAIYGAQAGNLALTGLSKGGVYIAGGIAPRIKERFLGEAFLQAFHNKGKMRHLMKDFYVAIIANPKVGLLGARHYASQLAQQLPE